MTSIVNPKGLMEKKKNTSGFPLIMGILNVTPDSFSDGGYYYYFDEAISHAEQLIRQGADIIDVGGESTRPGAKAVSKEEEIERVVPVIRQLSFLHPEIKISVDTTKAEVALEAIKAGAMIINDVSGLDFDPDLAKIAADHNAALVLMHMQGVPRTMQAAPRYDDVVNDVYNSLAEKINIARKAGAKDIIADVGIGFGKTLEHNLLLLRHHRKFRGLGVKMLLGISRKSFIAKILGIDDPMERDLPTAMIHAMMADAGADIIRVHNVAIINQLRTLHHKLFSQIFNDPNISKY